MKKNHILAAGILPALALAACQTSAEQPPSLSGQQLIELSPGALLVVGVEGVQLSPAATPHSAARSSAGELIHRVLQTNDGKLLFAYDLSVSKTAQNGDWKLQLMPAAQGPTFSAARQVSLRSADESVHVELMEQRNTGRTISDVFTLRHTQTRDFSVHGHLLAIHRYFRHLLQGE